MSSISGGATAIGKVAATAAEHHFNWGTAGKIAAAVGIGAGVLAVVAACGAPPKASDEVVKGDFGKFDKDGRDGVGLDEAQIDYIGTPYAETTSRYRVGDWVTRTIETRQRSWTDSAERGVRGADQNNDAKASWEELKGLAMRYDADKDNVLSNKEQRKFRNDYGVETVNSRIAVLSSRTEVDYDPEPRYPDPDYGGTSGGDSGYGGGYGSGGTSSGDSGGYDTGGGYGSGGTSGGDSGGYDTGGGYGSGGTSGGDSGGYDSGGSSGGSTSGGDSTSNGNPGYDDF